MAAQFNEFLQSNYASTHSAASVVIGYDASNTLGNNEKETAEETAEEIRKGFDHFVASRNKDNINEYYRGHTALMIATINGNFEQVQNLVQLGIDASLLNKEGLNAIWWAARQLDWQIFEYLLKHTKADLTINYQGATISWFAAKDARWDIVFTLIHTYRVRDLDAAFIQPKPTGRHHNILELAIMDHNFTMTQLAVENGATVNTSRDGITPLMRTLALPDLFKYLMIHGQAAVDASIPTAYVIKNECLAVRKIRSAAIRLFNSIREGNLTTEKLDLFVKEGAHLNQRSVQNNHTPLHMSVCLNKKSETEIILSFVQRRFLKTDQVYLLCETNEHGHTPLDTALMATMESSTLSSTISSTVNSTVSSSLSSTISSTISPENHNKTLAVSATAAPLTKRTKGVSSNLNPVSILVLDAIQILINREILELRTKLAWLKMNRLPHDLVESLQETLNENCFARTPLAKLYVKKAYLKAFRSEKIKAIANRTTKIRAFEKIDPKVLASLGAKVFLNPRINLKSCIKLNPSINLNSIINFKPNSHVITSATASSHAKTTANDKQKLCTLQEESKHQKESKLQKEAEQNRQQSATPIDADKENMKPNQATGSTSVSTKAFTGNGSVTMVSSSTNNNVNINANNITSASINSKSLLFSKNSEISALCVHKQVNQNLPLPARRNSKSNNSAAL